AIPAVSVIVGEDLSNDEELLNTFANLTRDITPAISLPPFLNFIHPSLHAKFFVFRLKYTGHLYKKHRQVIRSRIIQIIKQREHKKREFEPPADILQTFINLSEKDGLVDVETVTDYIIDIIFAAIHTTSQTITNSMVPVPNFGKELLEENERISCEIKDGYLTRQDVKKMIKLDSFIRETLRIWQPIVGLEHKTINDSFTFSNEIHGTNQNANTFDGFQHIEKNTQATKIGREYVPFGLGRHA
ncbi:1152_t:CDS:2, partial [Racocetra persica]